MPNSKLQGQAREIVSSPVFAPGAGFRVHIRFRVEVKEFEA